MGAQKYRSAIDASAILFQKIQKIWKNWQISKALFIDVKRGFDHASRVQLAQKIADLGIDNNFIEWT